MPVKEHLPFGDDIDDYDDEEFYPSSDGKPMAETIEHRDLMTYSIYALQTHFEDRTDAWVSGNDFIYYEEGNPKARVSPDCYVVFGIEHRERPSYRVWEEGGITPSVVIEFTSRKTKKEDQTTKFELYEKVLKVEEYFQFDPSAASYLKPRIRGYRLRDGVYVPIALIGGDRLYSEQLGLELVVKGRDLRFFNPSTGQYIMSPKEARKWALRENARADSAAEQASIQAEQAKIQAERAIAAESEVERLRAEIEALRHGRDENR